MRPDLCACYLFERGESVNGKLGKLPVRSDRRTLKLENYTTVMPAPPPRRFFQERVLSWPMFLNDRLGDCVIAAAGHMVMQWTTYARGIGAMPTDSLILEAYERIGGYVQGDPSTDNGCVMLTALNAWRKDGIGNHQIGGFASVFPDHRGIGEAVSLFGSAFIGVNLPLSAQQQTERWEVDTSNPSAAVPGSWGGHCVPIVGYQPDGVLVVTWGRKVWASWEFLAKYCDEAYAVLSRDWLADPNTAGKVIAPSGLDLATLLMDLGRL